MVTASLTTGAASILFCAACGVAGISVFVVLAEAVATLNTYNATHAIVISAQTDRAKRWRVKYFRILSKIAFFFKVQPTSAHVVRDVNDRRFVIQLPSNWNRQHRCCLVAAFHLQVV
jgi:hypothetical protein